MKSSVVDAAADHDIVGGGAVSDQLEVVAVLVGPEPRRVVVDRVSAEHGIRGGDALPVRVVEVLEAYVPTDAIRPPARDVTGGEDLGDVGASLGVDDDPVVDPQAGCGGRRHVGFDADADHDQIPGHGAGIGEFDQDTVGGGADRLDRSAGAQVDTVAAVQVGAHGAHTGTEDGAQRYRSSLDDGDVDTQGASRWPRVPTR